MGVLHERRGRDQHTIALIHLAIAIEVVGLAVIVGVDLFRGLDIGLPGRHAIGIGLDLGKTFLADEVLEGTLVAGNDEVIRLGRRGGERDVAVLVLAVGIDGLFSDFPDAAIKARSASY